MPHIILELSNNIIETQYDDILLQINKTLVENLPTKLDSCKGRIIFHKNFLVGDGNEHNAFIHANIEVLSGRSDEVLEVTSQKIINLLQTLFHESIKLLNPAISVSVGILPKAYQKN